MGLSVGGIYVRTRDRDRVVAAIKKHWLAVGAKELSAGEDPLALQPLGVEKTGKLGYAVWPATRDVEDTEWVAVYDSERYHGSGELAEFLAKELDALVVIYSFTSSVDAASLHSFRGASKQEKWYGNSENWGKVEGAVATLPYAFVYYNQLRGAAETEEGKELLDGLSIFGFEGMPYREGGYRGPSGEEQRGAALLEGVARAVAAGDVAAVRAAYEGEEPYRYAILKAVTDGVKRNFFDDPLVTGAELAGGQRVVLAMAEELLADASAYWRVQEVAEAAFWAGEQALFARAVQTLGRHVGGLEGLAHRLMKEKDFDRAVAVLRAVVGHEAAPLTAWNNLAHALFATRQLPDDAAELLARCDAHGMANSWIFHNTACGWIRLGDHERALAAVRGAVKAGYPALDKLRVDEDLRPLFADPRFSAAFEEGSAAKADELVVTKVHEGTPHVLQRPVLRFDFFLEVQSMSRIGPAVAALLEAYLADVPAGALQTARRNGPWKKLTKATLTKDVDKLRKARKSSFVSIEYRGATDESGGAPTEYGVHVDLWGESEEFGAHDKVPVVAVWFPAELAEGDVDAVAARFARYAALMPVEAARGGTEALPRDGAAPVARVVQGKGGGGDVALVSGGGAGGGAGRARGAGGAGGAGGGLGGGGRRGDRAGVAAAGVGDRADAVGSGRAAQGGAGDRGADVDEGERAGGSSGALPAAVRGAGDGVGERGAGGGGCGDAGEGGEGASRESSSRESSSRESREEEAFFYKSEGACEEGEAVLFESREAEEARSREGEEARSCEGEEARSCEGEEACREGGEEGRSGESEAPSLRGVVARGACSAPRMCVTRDYCFLQQTEPSTATGSPAAALLAMEPSGGEPDGQT